MKCISCGKELDDDARFCTNCGAKQDPVTAEKLDHIAEAALEAAAEAEAAGASAEEVSEIASETDEIISETSSLIGEETEAVVELAEEAAAEAESAVEPVNEIAEETESVIEQPHDIILPEPDPLPEPSAPEEDDPDFDKESAPILPGYPGAETEGEPLLDDPVPEYSDTSEEPDAPIKVGAGRLTGAAVITIFAIILLIVTSLLFSIKLGISGDIVKKRIEKMNLSTVLDSGLGDKSVSDTMFNEFGIEGATNGAANKYSFREYMGNTNLLEFAGEKAKGYTDYILSGSDSNPSVTVNNIVDFLADNADASKEAFDYELQAADYNSIRSRLESRNAGKTFSVEEWSRQLHFELANAKYIFSYITIGIFFALVLVLLIWIAVIVDKRGRHLMGFYGTVFTWSGLIVLLIGVAAYAGSAIANLITGQAAFYIAASVLLPFALFAAATGVFELVLGFIFRKIKKAIKAKQKRSKAVEKALAERA